MHEGRSRSSLSSDPRSLWMTPCLTNRPFPLTLTLCSEPSPVPTGAPVLALSVASGFVLTDHSARSLTRIGLRPTMCAAPTQVDISSMKPIDFYSASHSFSPFELRC